MFTSFDFFKVQNVAWMKRSAIREETLENPPFTKEAARSARGDFFEHYAAVMWPD
jgi:hypothetical protein